MSLKQEWHKFKESAVLVPIVFAKDEPCLLFTERSQEVEHHKGQICFPGGMRDASDPHLFATAVRETHEELGIPVDRIMPLGRLPLEITPSYFKIQPFVAVIKPFVQNELRLAKAEIANVILVPLQDLTLPQNFSMTEKEFLGQSVAIPYFQWNSHSIWGATGRMVVNLLRSMSLSAHHAALAVSPFEEMLA